MTDYSTYEDIELTRAWNYLETCVLNLDIKERMDRIHEELVKRRIYSWDKDGNILSVDNLGIKY